jgi:hypothetical protein
MANWPTIEQKRLIWRKLGVELYPAQLNASAALTGPRTLPITVQILGGERAGKSAFCGHETTALVPWCQLVYIVGLNYENAQAEFTYLVDDLRKLQILDEKTLSMPKEGSWNADVIGGACHIETLSLNRQGSDALIATGKAPDLIVLAEAGLLEEAHFVAAYMRCAEKRGAVILAGTLKRSRPWYVALFRALQVAGNKWNGKSFSFPAWENTAIYPQGANDPTLMALRVALGETLFQERLGAVPVPSPLLVFGREFEYAKHVADIKYDPNLPLWLAVDPGYAGAYALLVIQAASASDVRVIDEYYEQYATWDKAVAWLRGRPYVEQNTKGLILNVERAVMDVAGEQHHADKSQVEQWAGETGLRFKSEPVGIELGISRLRDFLRSPFSWEVTRIRIAPHCEGLIWELQEGEQYPKDQEGQPMREHPLDKANHARKAISYLLVNAYGRGEHDLKPANVKGHVGQRQVGATDLVRTTDGALRYGKKGKWQGKHQLSFHR